ncbi:MAG: hypothetical protein LBG87_04470 [Spirochaetaceae bacterium]|jgi:hypothetical protein|nr:hypothetical protein [Spirochaetaceae bacterium]
MGDGIVEILEKKRNLCRPVSDIQQTWDWLSKAMKSKTWFSMRNQVRTEASLFRSTGVSERELVLLVDNTLVYCYTRSDELVRFAVIFQTIAEAVKAWKQCVGVPVFPVVRFNRDFELGDTVILRTEKDNWGNITDISLDAPYNHLVHFPETNASARVQSGKLVLVAPNQERHSITDQEEWLKSV